ncbi:MAG: RsmB/NOP family class I SAM-dependent RNA methyltransferase [Pseudomonadota bacterium]
MTPGARVSAAIEILDEVFAGSPAERTLTRWARGSRFAGSKDRAAVRDFVFDGLRRRRSLGHLGGSDSGRAVMMALLADQDPGSYFSGEGFAPAPLSEDERARLVGTRDTTDFATRFDIPDFLEQPLKDALGARVEDVLKAQQSRAPVDLRVNTLRASVGTAEEALAEDDIVSERLPQAQGALRVTDNARRIQNSRAYLSGMVELQDLSSQIVALKAEARPGMTVLDYCAGGGGKTLALGAQMEGRGRLLAHDINPGRMKDIPHRAARAGLRVDTIDTRALPSLAGACDLVLVDAPCSGSGAWRRNPDSKWKLTLETLERLTQIQADILRRASAFVRPGGRMVYATCSLLEMENTHQIDEFLAAQPKWERRSQVLLTPVDAGDGFFFADLAQAKST